MTRGLKNSTPACGTSARYRRHVLLGEPTDQACRDAWAKRMAEFKARMKRDGRSLRPSIGTARRLQALSCLGWSIADIAERTQWTRSMIGMLRQNEHSTVTRETFETIVRVYDELSMSFPPPTSGSTRARIYARDRGWAPPLAWDDDEIDDPDAEPQGSRNERVAMPVRSGVDVIELLALGLSIEEIASYRHVDPRSIRRLIERHGVATVHPSLPGRPTGQAWMDDAACREIGPADAGFFTEAGGVSGANVAAKRVCRACPVRDECLEFALEHDEPYGIWGGLSPKERARLRTQRRAAAREERRAS